MSKLTFSNKSIILVSFFVLFSVFGLFFSFYLFNNPKNTPNFLMSGVAYANDVFQSTQSAQFKINPQNQTTPEKPSPFAQKLNHIPFTPTKIYSNDVDLDVELEEIGLTPEGALDVPSSWEMGGWYRKSSMPGEEGNIIIDGHYDTNYGAPAAFWDLKNLELGDKVILVDEVGRNFAYTITDLHYVDIKDSNRLSVLHESNGETLTLITCGGVWLPSEGTYNERLIVKAEFAGKIDSVSTPAQIL